MIGTVPVTRFALLPYRHALGAPITVRMYWWYAPLQRRHYGYGVAEGMPKPETALPTTATMIACLQFLEFRQLVA